MPQCVVIADDLTGANATGVLLNKVGYRTYTVMNHDRLYLKGLEECDCVVYPTDSRSVEPKIAYNRVYNAAKLMCGEDVKLVSKRIDSTLRGNLGSETDAILDLLGENSLAVIVPCFPSSKRVNVGGYLLVDTLPLHKTEVVNDPKTPVTTPCCAELYETQSKYPVGSVYIQDLMQGTARIAQMIRDYAAQGVRNIVFDAVTEEDIDLIADAVLESGERFAAVDPGVFTAAVARKLIAPSKQSHPHRILVSVGSVNAVAQRQVERLLASQRLLNVYMDTAEFLEGEERREREIERVVSEIVNGCEDYDVCSVIGKGIIKENRVPFEPYAERYGCSFDDLSTRINSAIAEVTYRIIAAGKHFDGLYTCGGDITVAVCKRMNNIGLRLLDEVLPLASYGVMMGGDYDGLKVITKGGMVGEPDAIVSCVQYLKQKLSI